MMGVAVVHGNTARARSISCWRSTVGAGRVAIDRLAPFDARSRISTAWSWSAFSRPVVRSRWRTGKSLVVRPTSRPSRTASPLTPGPASHPRVPGKADGAGLGAGASKRHSVRRAGAAAFVGDPSTSFASKLSTSRMAFGPRAG